MDTSGVLQIICLLFLIALSGFFSSAETALTTVNRVKMRALEESGNKRARTVNRILDQYGKMLSAILIGNNIVNISASALTTLLVIRLFGNPFVGLGTGILTLVILLAGEIIPKTRASLNAERISLSYARTVYLLMKILTPVIAVADCIAGAVLRFLHIDRERPGGTITETELKTYVDVSHEDGEIQAKEREMIYNVFAFSDTCAKDIMTPRVNMVTVNADDTPTTLLALYKDSYYSRIPVYSEEKDSMIGFINIKDFFLAGDALTDSGEKPLLPLMREAYYTYEYKKNADLLLEMKNRSMSVAFVQNEYGSTVGMLTLEDLLEELVGEIRDEYDEDEAELIQKTGERSYLIEGSMSLSDINDQIGTSLTSEAYDSIGGIVIGELNRLPEDGERVTLQDGTRLQVKGIDQARIDRVLLTLPNKTAPPDEEHA